jgi:hypothetical protein
MGLSVHTRLSPSIAIDLTVMREAEVALPQLVRGWRLDVNLEAVGSYGGE